MKSIVCEKCGSNSFTIKNGYHVCDYCDTKYAISKDDLPARQSEIALNSDVERLLKKCRLDPKNAKKYANLILDIDPGNTEARKYL